MLADRPRPHAGRGGRWLAWCPTTRSAT